MEINKIQPIVSESEVPLEDGEKPGAVALWSQVGSWLGMCGAPRTGWRSIWEYMGRKKWWNLGAAQFNKGSSPPSPQQRMNPCCLETRGWQRILSSTLVTARALPCPYHMVPPHCTHAMFCKCDYVVLVFAPLVSLACKVCSYFLVLLSWVPVGILHKSWFSTIRKDGNLRASPCPSRKWGQWWVPAVLTKWSCCEPPMRSILISFLLWLK